MKLTRKDILFFILSAFFLSPILFFPISTDLSIFVSAGRTIFEGGKIYVDYIDLKQPLIYYVFAFFHILTSSTEFGLRAIDFVFQFATIIYLFLTVRKYSGNKNLAHLTSAIYAIAYTSLSHNQTMQIENFAGMFILILLNRQMTEKKNLLDNIFTGVALGILASLKVTLGVVIFALVFDDFLKRKLSFGKIVKRFISIGVTAFIIFGISLFPLLDSQVRSGFGNILRYLIFYSSTPPFNLDTLYSGIKLTSVYLADNFTVVMLGGLFAGIYLQFQKRGESNLLKTCFIFTVVLLITVAAERKFYVYHFQRIQIFLMIFTGAGLYFLWTKSKEHWLEKSGYPRFILASILILAIPLSPVIRWFNINQGTIYYFTDKSRYDQFYERPNQSVILREQHIETAEFIKSNSTLGERVIVMSSASNSINYFLRDVKTSRFSLSCFYFGNFKIEEWQKIFENEVMRSEWLVVQDNDRNYDAFGHYFTSMEMLKKNQRIYGYVLNNFIEIKLIGFFHIYKRLPNNKTTIFKCD